METQRLENVRYTLETACATGLWLITTLSLPSRLWRRICVLS